MITNKNQSVLIVDDMPGNIAVLLGVLEGLGEEYTIRAATSGKQALKIVAAYPPDLILLDIMMPEMDGYEVLEQLKSQPDTRNIPVIFITALDSDENETKGLSLGAIDYLTKPINAAITLARIKNHLELKVLRDQMLELNRNLEHRVKEEVAKNMELERLGLLGKLIDMGHEAVTVTDASNCIVAVNHAFTVITGYSKEEVLGKNPKIMSSGQHPSGFYQHMWQKLNEQDAWQGEIWNRRKDGKVYPLWLNISVIRDHDNKIVNHIATFTDISEHMEAQEKIRHMALHDSLTGLPNRPAMNEQLARDLLRATRHQKKLAVIMMDLDHFKGVNDSLGHAAGDLLLVGVGGRMRSCLRADDFICRLGGDEFVLILHDINTTKDVADICDKLLQSISMPYSLNGLEGNVTPSIGISLFPDDGDSENVLLQNADTAMYQAKTLGRANYQFYKCD